MSYVILIYTGINLFTTPIPPHKCNIQWYRLFIIHFLSNNSTLQYYITTTTTTNSQHNSKEVKFTKTLHAQAKMARCVSYIFQRVLKMLSNLLRLFSRFQALDIFLHFVKQLCQSRSHLWCVHTFVYEGVCGCMCVYTDFLTISSPRQYLVIALVGKQDAAVQQLHKELCLHHLLHTLLSKFT